MNKLTKTKNDIKIKTDIKNCVISKKLHSAIEKEIRFLRFDIKISKNDKQVYYLDHRDQRIIFTRL